MLATLGLELRDLVAAAAPLGTLALAAWLACQDRRRARDLQQLRHAAGAERRSARRRPYQRRRRSR